MKKIWSLFLCLIVLCASLGTPVTALSPDEDWKPVPTLEEYQQLEEKNNPAIPWDTFSALGGYTPQYYSDYYVGFHYDYLSGKHEYRMTMKDLSSYYDEHLESTLESYADDFKATALAHWNQYRDKVDTYSIKQFMDIKEWYWADKIVWMDPAAAPEGDLTRLQPTEGKECYVTLLDGRIVFEYASYGLILIHWIHDGIWYQLSLDVRGGAYANVYNPFDEGDIGLVRRLTNVNTCQEALDTLMEKIEVSATEQMPVGTTLPSKSNENKVSSENKKTLIYSLEIGALVTVALAGAAVWVVKRRKR